MLQMPLEAEHTATILGIDPGSDTLGVGILTFDVRTLAIVSTQALTLNGTRNGRGSFATEVHGDRYGRIESHKQELIRIFRLTRPMAVASESPFMSRRRPQAYGALTEVVCAIRAALLHYDCWQPLEMIDPPTVKRAVGVDGRTGGPEGKKLMQTALLRMEAALHYDGFVPMQQLDEHSIDALAVAYCHYMQLLEKLCLMKPKPSSTPSSLLSYLQPSVTSSTRTIRRKKKTKRSRRK